MAPYHRRFSYQYRLVYQFKTERRRRVFTSDQAFAVLSRLHRLGTSQPWLGCTEAHLKHSWSNLAKRLNVPIQEVLDTGIKQALVSYYATFPSLSYIRVECRQVGAWTPVLDPMKTLSTVQTEATLKKRTALLARIEQMTQAELDTWRQS